MRFSYGEAGKEPQPYLTSPTFSGTNLVGGIAQGTGFTPTQGGVGGLFYTFTKPASDAEAGAHEGDGRRLRHRLLGRQGRLQRHVVQVADGRRHSRDADSAVDRLLQRGEERRQVRECGAELSLNLRPITRTNYQLGRSGMGWGKNQSLVKDIAGADFLYLGQAFIGNVAKVGYPLGVVRGYGWIRCGISSDARRYPFIDGVRARASRRARSSSTTARIAAPTPACRAVTTMLASIGDPNPKWTGNAHTSFKYGKMEFSGLVDVRKGGFIWNGTKGALWSYGTHKDTEGRAMCTGPPTRHCTGNNKTFGAKRLVPGSGHGSGRRYVDSDRRELVPRRYRARARSAAYDEPCIEDGGYVKLREISVAYTFDQAWVARSLGMSTHRPAHLGSQPQDVDEVHRSRSRDQRRWPVRASVGERTTSTCRSRVRSSSSSALNR